MSNYATTVYGGNSIARATFYNRVYAWMCSGLALTAVVAVMVNHVPALKALAMNGPFMIGSVILGLILVMAIAAGAKKMGAALATLCFLVYAAINGFMFSGLLQIYPQATLGAAFGITAGMFAACSIYGFVTKRDLSGLGGFLFMGLIGLLIALIVNIFIANTFLDWIINFAGVVIFTLLTAYDTQQLREYDTDPDMAPVGALTLYLDFVNLFLYILRILGMSSASDD